MRKKRQAKEEKEKKLTREERRIRAIMVPRSNVEGTSQSHS